MERKLAKRRHKKSPDKFLYPGESREYWQIADNLIDSVMQRAQEIVEEYVKIAGLKGKEVDMEDEDIEDMGRIFSELEHWDMFFPGKRFPGFLYGTLRGGLCRKVLKTFKKGEKLSPLRQKLLDDTIASIMEAKWEGVLPHQRRFLEALSMRRLKQEEKQRAFRNDIDEVVRYWERQFDMEDMKPWELIFEEDLLKLQIEDFMGRYVDSEHILAALSFREWVRRGGTLKGTRVDGEEVN